MSDPVRLLRLAALRAEVQAITAAGRAAGAVLPFGVEAIDRRLAAGGLAVAALHEATGGGATGGGAAAGTPLADDAAATLFLAGLAARRAAQADAPVLWAFARRELFAPGLQQAGLGPDRLIYAEAGEDAAVLAVVEEGLRHGGLAAVVGEVAKAVPMAATRRLQLMAEEHGTTALLLRRPLRSGRDPLAEPSAAATRWRIGCAPSTPTEVGEDGIGRAQWRLDLVRQRGGDSFTWTMEAADAAGRLSLPAGFHDRSHPAAGAADGDALAA